MPREYPKAPRREQLVAGYRHTDKLRDNPVMSEMPKPVEKPAAARRKRHNTALDVEALS